MLFWCVSFQFYKNALGTHHTWVYLSLTPRPPPPSSCSKSLWVLQQAPTHSVPRACLVKVGAFTWCPLIFSNRQQGGCCGSHKVRQETSLSNDLFPEACPLITDSMAAATSYSIRERRSWLVAYWFTGLVLAHSCLLYQGCEVCRCHSWLS